MINRRSFLQSSALAVASTRGASSILRAPSFTIRPSPAAAARDEALRHLAAPELAALARRALDAAMSAGANFADVRVTRLLTRELLPMFFTDTLEIGFGVRVLVDGFWGFAGSDTWTEDEAVRLANNAVAQAKVYRWTKARDLEWTPPASPAVGEWATPISRDGLEIAPAEVMDYLSSMQSFNRWHPDAVVFAKVLFGRDEQLYVSSEGANTTQRQHRMNGYLQLNVTQPSGRQVIRYSRLLDVASGSYDYFRSIPLLDGELPRMYDSAMREPLPQPADVGRYDMVFDAYAMAGLVGETIGIAAPVDRVRGYEANAAGTSYLGPVDATFGEKPLAPPFVTIRGDRTSPHGAASVRWDTDGVPTEAFDIVRDGRVVDLPTSREHLALMQPWYRQHGGPRGSHGCSYAENGLAIPLVCPPNVTLEPAAEDVSFEQLVADTKDGIAVFGGNTVMDQQQLTGMGLGSMWRIKQGKLDAPLVGGAYLFRSPEFWKNVRAIGGASSVQRRGLECRKGQPEQSMAFTVSAVPAKVGSLAVSGLSANHLPSGGAH